MSEVQKHMDLLGRPAIDKVTGFSGVVTALSFDLYGCIQVVLTPRVGEDSKLKDEKWFDVSRLSMQGKPVMDRPNFDEGLIAKGLKGGCDKPLP